MPCIFLHDQTRRQSFMPWKGLIKYSPLIMLVRFQEPTQGEYMDKLTSIRSPSHNPLSGQHKICLWSFIMAPLAGPLCVCAAKAKHASFDAPAFCSSKAPDNTRHCQRELPAPQIKLISWQPCLIKLVQALIDCNNDDPGHVVHSQ